MQTISVKHLKKNEVVAYMGLWLFSYHPSVKILFYLHQIGYCLGHYVREKKFPYYYFFSINAHI